MGNAQNRRLQSSSRDSVRTCAGILALVLVWANFVAAGMLAFNRFEQTEGGAARSNGDWPAGSNLRREAGKPTLVVIAHPQCFCTEATLANGKDTPATSRLIRRARRIPGVRVIIDRDAHQVREFPAQTSVQTFLYDLAGRLVFSGGITAARGHEGPSQGTELIRQALKRRPAPRQRTPVFGCGLPSVATEGRSK